MCIMIRYFFVKKLNWNQFPTQNVEHVSLLVNSVCEPELWTKLDTKTFSNWYIILVKIWNFLFDRADKLINQ